MLRFLIIVLCLYVNSFLHGKSSHNDLRYAAIHKVLTKYKRPFTMLDIDTKDGKHVFKAAATFKNSVFVMISDTLQNACKTHPELQNIILLNKAPRLDDLIKLSECEHFDVIVAKNILQNFPTTWSNAITCFLRMGHSILIEVPSNHKQSAQMKAYLLRKGAKLVAKIPNSASTLYLIQTGTLQYLQRKTWLTPLNYVRTHKVICTFEKKELRKRVHCNLRGYTVTSKWHPGINLLSFKMYHGSWPTNTRLKEELTTLQHVPHQDWNAKNMIVQGQKLILIDFKDPQNNPANPGSSRIVCTPIIFANHCNLIDIDDPTQAQEFFCGKLLPKSQK